MVMPSHTRCHKSLGCHKPFALGEEWYFYYCNADARLEEGWEVEYQDYIWCGELAFRDNSPIRLCVGCLKKLGLIW